MLPKKERVSRELFNRFFSRGGRSHTPYFTCVHVPFPTFHAGVVVSKKIYARAVDRNKLRRQMYATLSEYRREFPLTGVYIFIMKRDARDSTFPRMREVTREALRTLTRHP